MRAFTVIEKMIHAFSTVQCMLRAPTLCVYMYVLVEPTSGKMPLHLKIALNY
jgi:hypothetical protein